MNKIICVFLLQKYELKNYFWIQKLVPIPKDSGKTRPGLILLIYYLVIKPVKDTTVKFCSQKNTIVLSIQNLYYTLKMVNKIKFGNKK